MLFNFKHTYTQLPEILFSDCLPDAVSNPQLVAFNPELASQLQIDTNGVSTDTFAQYLSGNKVEPNSRPLLRHTAVISLASLPVWATDEQFCWAN